MAFRWYVAQTKPCAEAAACRRLKDQDFTTYLPIMTLRNKKRRGYLVIANEPLFPGYAFVQLDIEDDTEERWKRVNSTKAIHTLLPTCDAPIAIPNGQVESLQDAEAMGQFVYPRAFPPGTKLRVEVGMLAGQVIECLATNDRQGVVRALWDCFGARRVITVPLNGIRALR